VAGTRADNYKKSQIVRQPSRVKKFSKFQKAVAAFIGKSNKNLCSVNNLR
jgi:hypothetical protein